MKTREVRLAHRLRFTNTHTHNFTSPLLGIFRLTQSITLVSYLTPSSASHGSLNTGQALSCLTRKALCGLPAAAPSVFLLGNAIFVPPRPNCSCSLPVGEPSPPSSPLPVPCCSTHTARPSPVQVSLALGVRLRRSSWLPSPGEAPLLLPLECVLVPGWNTPHSLTQSHTQLPVFTHQRTPKHSAPIWHRRDTKISSLNQRVRLTRERKLAGFTAHTPPHSWHKYGWVPG